MKETFKSKRQMTNYYNKMKKDPKISLCMNYFDGVNHQWVCEYWYKKVGRSMKTR